MTIDSSAITGTGVRAYSASPSAALQDQGTYSARNIFNGALIPEAAKIFAGLHEGSSLPHLRAQAVDGVLFSARARSSRERIWSALHARYLVSQPDWVLRDFLRPNMAESQNPEFVSLLYLYYCIRDHLTFDFVTEILWSKKCKNQRSVSVDDLLHLLDSKIQDEPQTRRWSDASRRKLASSILTSLRDFGVLDGQQRKVLTQPILPRSTAKHLLRLQIAAGARGSAILRDSSWRLFFFSEDDVAHLLNGLSQEREVKFERIASTVVLDFPADWAASP